MGKKHKKHKIGNEEGQSLPRLVLKVQKDELPDGEGGSTKGDVHSSKSHKKKKKKDKKHRHRDDESSSKKSKKRDRSEHGQTQGEPSMKKLHIKLAESAKPVEPVQTESVDQYNNRSAVALKLCLENLHLTLQRKDVCNVFAFPVTDEIAPGYSKIIKHSMDFSTMMMKVDRGSYTTIEEFKDDFILMCDNAMIYNSQDTIYYKAAEKLRSYGMKLLSKDRVKHMKHSIGLDYSSDDYESDHLDNDFDDSALIDVDTIENLVTTAPKKQPPKKKRENKAAEIHANAIKMAKEAARKVKEQNPNGKIGFLRKDNEGNTTLAVLNPDGISDGPAKIVTIGKLAGSVKREPAVVTTAKDEAKPASVPVSYLMYGPYGSFAPTHDSSLATLSKADSDLLMTTYGSEQGMQYAKSLQNFVGDSPLFAQDLVDRFLNALTGGAHMSMLKAQGKKHHKEPLPAEGIFSKVDIIKKEGKAKDLSAGVDVESLLSLAKDGIDVSFLDEIVKETNIEKASIDIKSKLNANSLLLEDLQRTQAQRLSDPAKEKKVDISEKETGIADVLAVNLRKLLSEVSPGEIASDDSLRNALGVGVIPQNATENTSTEGCGAVSSLS